LPTHFDLPLSLLVMALTLWLVAWSLRREDCSDAQACVIALTLSVAGFMRLAGTDLPDTLWLCAVVAVCSAVAVIDARTYLIPDILVLWLGGLALLAPFSSAPQAQLVEGALVGGLFWLVRAGYFLLRGREGLGLGDVKFAVVMGTILGYQAALLAVAIATASTAAWLVTQRQAAAPDDQGDPAVGPAIAPLGVGLGLATAIMTSVSLLGKP
jgi:leader peptidase (prepilin peptidase)/N-methyltransferase